VAEPVSAGSDLSHAASIRFALWAAIAVAAAIALAFAFEGAVGFNLADEGYLWYGAQRLLDGDVPIRDFASYDPGRYLWSAAVMRVLGGSGILSLRIGAFIFQGLGLFVAILLLRRAAPRASLIFFLLAGATLLLWMVPRHKVFDITISIVLIAALAELIGRPTMVRYFLMGAVVGAAAIFGRNHGVYGCAAGLAASGVLAWQGSGATLLRAFAAFAAGVFLGFLPMLIALAMVPGFYDAFLHDVLAIFEYGGTNLALPVPWPWRVAVSGQPWLEVAQHLLVGFFFVAVLAFAVLGPVYVLLTKLTRANATFAAAAFLAVPYAHFAFSRADVAHLAQGIFPLLIGLMLAPSIRSERARLVLVSALLAASLFIVAPMHPGWVAWKDGNWQRAEVGRDRLAVPPGVKSDLDLLGNLVEKYAPDGRAFMVAPYWPGAYAVFDRKAPVRDIYPLFPQSAAGQEAEIARIRAANPGFVAVLDTALDGLDARRYRNTHPLIYQFIIDNFEPVSDGRGALQVYVPRPANP